MKKTTAQEQTQNTLNLFVYGTLKRGYWNHDRLCRDAISIEQAMVRGRLYALPSGIPILRVPESDILAVGTASPVIDATTQWHRALDAVVTCGTQKDGWDLVRGELALLPDPALSLPPIDRLEGYRPGDFRCLYSRVLVPAWVSEQLVAAWCYVSLGEMSVGCRPMGHSEWSLSNSSGHIPQE